MRFATKCIEWTKQSAFLTKNARIMASYSWFVHASRTIRALSCLDPQLARRFDSVSLPRWTAGKEFEQLVLAIVRNLPLKEPSVLTVKCLRRILQTSGGVSAHIFRMLNDVAIDAIETGAERITDEALNRYKRIGENEATFQ